MGSLKINPTRIWDEEGLGRAWIDPAVIGMIQVNSREGLAWIPSPKTRLWVGDSRLHFDGFCHTEHEPERH